MTRPHAAPHEATRPAESRALTGLRGVAALWVVAHHLHLGPLVGVGLGPLEILMRRGYFAVDLFFVLSGFVLAMVHGHWFQGRLQPRLYATFLVRRVARLWPLHVAALVFVLVTGAHLPHTLSVRNVGANLALIQAWGISISINAPSWSASTELLAAVLFPAFVALVLGSRAGAVAGVVLAVGLLVAAIDLAPVGLMRRGLLDIYFNNSPLALLRCLAGTLVGIAAWRWHRIPLPRWSAPAAILGTLALLAAGLPDVLAYPLLPIVVLGLHQGRDEVWRWLSRGPAYALGGLSYAIYLTHEPIIVLFPFAALPAWAGTPLYLALMLAVAALAHAAIERPARLLLRRTGERALAALPG